MKQLHGVVHTDPYFVLFKYGTGTNISSISFRPGTLPESFMHSFLVNV